MGFPNWRSFHSSADYTCWPHVCYFLSTNLCFCATRCISHSLHQDDSLCVFLALLLTWTFSIRSRARTQESSFWNLPIIVVMSLMSPGTVCCLTMQIHFMFQSSSRRPLIVQDVVVDSFFLQKWSDTFCGNTTTYCRLHTNDRHR